MFRYPTNGKSKSRISISINELDEIIKFAISAHTLELRKGSQSLVFYAAADCVFSLKNLKSPKLGKTNSENF